MLLTLSTTHSPATDLGYLLHKHPDRVQSFGLNFGQAHVFYPEASAERCTACLLLEVDPVQLVRGKGRNDGLLDQYVNDRPYVASSLMSVALVDVYRTAMSGRCQARPDLAETSLPITARIDVLPVRGGEEWLARVFEPLGYLVMAERHALDPQFPEWGESPYYSVTLTATTTLARLLQHLYVLIPVFDGKKHYYIGPDEVEKLLAKGEEWLADHPEREFIARRYLARRPGLVREALQRLLEVDALPSDEEEALPSARAAAETEREISLHQQRLAAVLGVLRDSGAKRVLDLGCGEGKLLRELLANRQFSEIVGMDVSIRSLEIAHRRLKLDRLPEQQRARIRLLHGALTYRDDRLAGFDAAAMVEVIEHLDPGRLESFERVVFEYARPKLVALTTPNREYNVVWESLTAGEMRHGDHRFEWSRDEFATWAKNVAERFGYQVRTQGVGTEVDGVGSPSQMAIFELATEKGGRTVLDG